MRLEGGSQEPAFLPIVRMAGRNAGPTVLLLLLAVSLHAAPAAQRVGDSLYAYISDHDASSNSTFLVGPRGILVVDTGFDGREGQKLLAAIRAVSPLPVRYIINTHYHRDHQAANGVVGPEAEVISTDWTRQRTLEFLERDLPRLEKQLTGEAADSLRSTRFRPATITVSRKAVIYVGDFPVEIDHPGPAHTRGDLLVYFPRQRVISTGDLFLTNSSPAMDRGSVLNWIKALEDVLAGPAETVVPGHFGIASQRELQRFHDYLADLRDQVRRIQESGASLEQVRQGLRMEKYADFRQYPRFHATFADNAEVLFQELSEKAGAPGSKPH